jgi:N-acetylmuramoyl-L-alanine amidase
MRLKKENIHYLIVHQSATDRDTTTFQQIKKFHLYQGMGNIAYQYFITADGKIKRGRNELTQGTHTKASQMNEKSLGICLAGDFNKQEPTPKQLQSLSSVLKSLVNKYSIPIENILAHREVAGSATECPGDSLNEWLVDWRNSQTENRN